MTPSYRTTDHVLVRVKDLVKSFGDNVVLSGVNFDIHDIRRTDRNDIEQGQIVSLLGPSGIGKSTLFNIMAGLLEPDGGRVLIDNPVTAVVPGSTTEDLIPTRRGLVGVVYQDYRLFPFMKVENLLLDSLKTSGVEDPDERSEKVEEYLEWFQLREHRSKFSSQLSGGQRQRVAIAQQLLRSPQLLLMDEPFSGLDPETKGGVVRMINDLAKRNEYLTIVVISHDISSSLKVSDTVLFMGRNRSFDETLLPGSSIIHEKTISLKDRGLAWSDGDINVARDLSLIELDAVKLFPYLSGSR